VNPGLPVSRAETRWRDEKRREAFQIARLNGRLQEFIAQPVDHTYLPHVADEDAQEMALFMVERARDRASVMPAAGCAPGAAA